MHLRWWPVSATDPEHLHTWDRAERDLSTAAARVDVLLSDGGTINEDQLLIALQTVFREAAAHWGGCCMLDCKEHAALVEAARVVLRSEM